MQSFLIKAIRTQFLAKFGIKTALIEENNVTFINKLGVEFGPNTPKKSKKDKFRRNFQISVNAKDKAFKVSK